ncbi:UBIQUINONE BIOSYNTHESIS MONOOXYGENASE COQ6 MITOCHONDRIAL [Salix purpurea]|uniref:Ubiquinone biosynthesis monooxygenase COQ6, mitochondrial n=1 Tax=Salix purpurea TaxID=77065 RepID=A0A9Q0TK17_SALPP|nr:UBIQUINONE BIOSYNTHESIS MONOOXYGENASE COQ6 MITOCHONDRIAL [Salix purpurea]
MNRVIARKVVPTYHQIFKLSRKQFCSDEAAKSSAAAASSQFNQESDANLSLTGNVQPYDIAIVGGGMVGMALACSLATTPLTKHLRVAIIDSSPALANKPCIKREDPPDPRVSTVTPATISFFKDTGAWQYVQQHRHAYFDKMQVWDYTSLGYTKYDARDVDKEVLGCVVENKVLHSSLLSRIEDTDFQKTIYHSRLTSMSLNPSSSSIVVDSTAPTEASYARGSLAKLGLSDGNSLYAKLVVGSDGGKSQVRELAGFKTTGWKYSQNAVICTVEHSVENYCAWQRFLPAGPIALLPIGDKFSNIVWTMNPEESSDFKSVKEDDFVKAVNHALDYGYGGHPKSSLPGSAGMFSWLRGNVTISANESFEIPPKVVKLASERMAFPLSLMHANEYASKRVVLIGDAAHTVHPLAGQGVNLGFGDAFALSRIIAEGIAVGMDIGEVSLLKKYEAERKLANMTMMAILDGFQKAYSIDFGPLNILRAAAFHGAHFISPLKRSIISFDPHGMISAGLSKSKHEVTDKLTDQTSDQESNTRISSTSVLSFYN